MATAVDRLTASKDLAQAQADVEAKRATAMRGHFTELARRSGATDEMLSESDAVTIEKPVTFDASTKITLWRDGAGLPSYIGYIDRADVSSVDRRAFALYGETGRTYANGVERFDVRLARP